MSRERNRLIRRIREDLAEMEEKQRWKRIVKSRFPWWNVSDDDWFRLQHVPAEEVEFRDLELSFDSDEDDDEIWHDDYTDEDDWEPEIDDDDYDDDWDEDDEIDDFCPHPYDDFAFELFGNVPYPASHVRAARCQLRLQNE